MTKVAKVNVAPQRKEREEMTREMLIQHIEALTTSGDTMKAALKVGVSYPTFLARFRRLGLKVTEVRERVLVKHEMPEMIAAQVFKKIDKQRKAKVAENKNVLKFRNFKELAQMLHQAANQLQSASAA